MLRISSGRWKIVIEKKKELKDEREREKRGEKMRKEYKRRKDPKGTDVHGRRFLGTLTAIPSIYYLNLAVITLQRTSIGSGCIISQFL